MMKLKIVIFVIPLLFVSVVVNGKEDAYTRYIDTYSRMAMDQQAAHGIPASITLAQGLLESHAGQSTLASKGNNHFGIKCHRGWEGDTLLRNDDAANECFRAYSSADESFEDHSRFLLKPRYKPLFENEVTDYVAWAHGLKACGYATDPNYAMRLITIIERYGLYLYDIDSHKKAEEDAGFIQQMLLGKHPVRKSRGLHCVIASPGDTYSTISKELGLAPNKLMEYNDCKKDGEIKAWEEVYLQPKRDVAPDGIDSVTIGEGESVHSICQRFGIKQDVVMRLNPKAKDRPGTRLRLR